MTDDSFDDSFDVAVLGAGSAATSFVGAVRGVSVVVFEPALVGGACPYVACIPSKSMLHDAKAGHDWATAIRRRDDLVSHLDDTDHARGLREDGAVIVRERAVIDGPGRVRAGDTTYAVDHVVIATGARPTHPDVDGLEPDHDRVWTSRDALTTHDRPDSLVILGGGVIGSELAYAYARFGTAVTTLDESTRPAEDLHPAVGERVAGALRDVGVDVVNGVTATRVELGDTSVTVHLDDGSTHVGDRLLVATGRRPDVTDIGLESIGIDADELRCDDRGAVVGAPGVWVAGDAAGRQQYTHLANHHGEVLADQIAGGGTRRYDEVVVPACVFVDPPVLVVGPPWAELRDDDDVVWAEVEIDTARTATDQLAKGFVAVAARRSTGCVVAANGIGPGIDLLGHAFVVAIDGAVPVERLARTLQPFPTVGDALSPVYAQLLDRL